MFGPRLVSATIAAFLLVAASACAQEPARSSDNAIREGVAESLPDWWRITEFEVSDQEQPAETVEPADAVEPVGKGPGAAAMGNVAEGEVSDKPGAIVPGAATAPRFAATLELTEQIYEPLYALDGTAIVQPIMEAGDQIGITGYALSQDDAVFADPGDIHLDQEGFVDLGRPLDAFDMPALVLGTPEADEFLASRDAVRAEGTMRKVMGDAGEEL